MSSLESSNFNLAYNRTITYTKYYNNITNKNTCHQDEFLSLGLYLISKHQEKINKLDKEGVTAFVTILLKREYNRLLTKIVLESNEYFSTGEVESYLERDYRKDPLMNYQSKHLYDLSEKDIKKAIINKDERALKAVEFFCTKVQKTAIHHFLVLGKSRKQIEEEGIMKVSNISFNLKAGIKKIRMMEYLRV